MTSVRRPRCPASSPKRGSTRTAVREEAARLCALHEHAVLDTPPEPAFERIVRLAARFLQMPVALVSFVDQDRQWFKAVCGLEVRETPRRVSFCAHAIEGEDVMVVPDATRDPRFADNPLVTGQPFLQFYAGAPLRTADGRKLGTLCVLDHRPREFDEAGRQILRELAATVIDELELRRVAAALRLQVAQRERAERKLAEALRSVESQVVARTAELSRRNDQQQVVAGLGALALAGGEVDALLAVACRRVKDTLGIDFCGVAEHQPARGVFVTRCLAGVPAGESPPVEMPNGTASGSGYAVLTGEPVIIEDAATETRFKLSQWSLRSGARSGIVVLIGGDGTHLPTYGVFNVFSRARRAFSPDDVFFLQGVANVLAAAISRRRGEEALRVAKEESELANSAKSSFLSRMSHELRTPLNAILGFSQILQMDATTERQQECLKHVLTSGQQLLALIDDVLDISRLELVGGTLATDAVVPREALSLCIDLIRPLAAPRAVTVALVDSPDLDCAVLVHGRRFQQMMLNLLANAVKYNRPGGRVTVSCRVMPAARLRVAVTDTGPGIAPTNLARLFVPFDRLGAERTDVPGTGLGLALCKNLAEAQGGEIGVESTVGTGSTFWIQLPLAPPAPPALLPTANPAAGVHPPRPPARRVPRRRARTILYVEDNVSNLRLIERLLQRRPGIRLLSATLAREGLELARRRRPDLILLDSHLPDLSGLEVIAALRADPATRAIPVVVVSADALPASIEALRAAGARHYLTKPLDVHRLVELLTELA